MTHLAYRQTVLYFIRHAESVFIPGQERERGLSEKGKADALKIAAALRDEKIDLFVSSPYARAVDTIRDLAREHNKGIELIEDLRERTIGTIPDGGFAAAKQHVFEHFDFSFPGGESSRQAQRRAVNAIQSVVRENEGKAIAVGTHGDIMTLMLQYYDPRYGFEFWRSTTMPDLYRVEFREDRLEGIARLWQPAY